MSTTTSGNDNKALLTKAIVELKKYQNRIKELEAQLTKRKGQESSVQHVVGNNEEVAVIGMACRFPGGANSPEQLWSLLDNGVNAVCEVPKTRWNIDDYYESEPGTPGKIYTKYGYFIDDIAGFDRDFFNVSPTEAQAMDPQHRLLLETTWEAFEYAGYDPHAFNGGQVGVFVGAMNSDYSHFSIRESDSASMYTAITNGNGMAAGRVAHNFGFEGPTIAVDTLCSSSLVSTHLAVRSLLNNECDLAVTSGVNLMLTPSMYIVTCAAQMLAADGLCKSFDASADGYARGEGCGTLLLKRLSDAQRDNDNILAVIKGSAVNQDGASSSIATPNGGAQEKVIRAALKDAGVSPADIGYVEAHGTGTALGDPIEVEALQRVFSERTGAKPLIIGSIKSNIGHTEGAAGVAGLIKTILSMRSGTIPAHLNVSKLSEHIDWKNMVVKVATSPVAWQDATTNKPFACVSSFGLGGTNANIVLAAAPSQESVESDARVNGQAFAPILTLSTRTQDGLSRLVERYQTRLTKEPLNLSSLCYTSNVGRANFMHRAAFIATTTDQLITQLKAFQADHTEVQLAGSYFGNANQFRNGATLLFTGTCDSTLLTKLQGLYGDSPVFRSVVTLVQEQADVNDLVAILSRTQADQKLSFVSQLMLEICLARFLNDIGVQIRSVAGLNFGEYSAAAFAGVMDLVQLKCLVEDQLQPLLTSKSDLSVFSLDCDSKKARALLRQLKQAQVEAGLLAIQSQQCCWIFLSTESIDTLNRLADDNQLVIQELESVDASLLTCLTDSLDGITQWFSKESFQPPQLRFLSGVSGQYAEGDITNERYWLRHLRSPSTRYKMLDTLNSTEMGGYIVLGSDHYGELMSATEGTEKSDDVLALNSSIDASHWLSKLWSVGVSIDWQALHEGQTYTRQILPSYPFEHQDFWLEHGFYKQGNSDSVNTDEAPLNHSQIVEQVYQLVANVRGINRNTIADTDTFLDTLGYDSMMLMELKGKLEQRLNDKRKIPAKDMMSITTVGQLIDYIKSSNTYKDIV
jgi:acyl carrier protein